MAVAPGKAAPMFLMSSEAERRGRTVAGEEAAKEEKASLYDVQN